MSQRPVPPRGMRDLLPEEVLQRRHLLERILPAYERYGFQQIETPVLEELDRLIGSEGGDNEKLIFKVLKRGLQWDPAPETEATAVDLGLRYDLTVPLARFYTTHSETLLSPFKSIQTGSVFRAERPQKGRYRQFTQCDIDTIGDGTVAAEIELVCATAEALQACNVNDVTVRVNDRRLLDSLVRSAGFKAIQVAPALIALDKVDKVGVEGVFRELQQIDEGPAAKQLADWLGGLLEARGFEATLNALPDNIDTSAIEDLQTIITGVAASLPWLKMELDTTLVRGQGYYTGAIFEIEHPASSGSLAGGGRYDRMIGKISGKDVPACGLSIGFERLWDVMGSTIDTTAGKRRIAFLHNADAALDAVTAQAQTLRGNGDIVRREVAAKNRNGQLKRLSAAGFTHWTAFAEDDLAEVQQLTS